MISRRRTSSCWVEVFGRRFFSRAPGTAVEEAQGSCANSSDIGGINNKYPISVLLKIDSEISRFKSLKKSTAKIFLPKHIASFNITSLKSLISSSFADLENEDYLLGYSIPLHSIKGNAGNATAITPVLTDLNVHTALCEARDNVLPVHIHVRSNPGIFPPVSSSAPNSYLKNMPSPDLLESYTMLSFYKFKNIQDPETLIVDMRKFLAPFGALGRIYVANEGINAQMAVPTNVMPFFQLACNKSHIFSSSDGYDKIKNSSSSNNNNNNRSSNSSQTCTHASENNCENQLFLNIDHVVSKEDFMKNKPFSGLRITHREQIVADGFNRFQSRGESGEVGRKDADKDANHINDSLETSLNWSDRGYEMSPLEWHDAIENADKTNTIVIDCRNSYESDVGKFKNAIPLNTLFFKESWDALDEVLSDKPKDIKVLTYCTGGIRCVKVNSYLKQKKGFQNVHSLQGGIINYVKEIEKTDKYGNDSINDSKSYSDCSVAENNRNTATMGHRHVESSKFMGINFVFDERLGTRITKDHLAVCETCGSCNYDSFCNCLNPTCHIRFIQCRNCNIKYNGCCSKYCQLEFDKYLSLKLEKEEENRKIREHNVSVKVSKGKREVLMKYSSNTMSSLVNNNLTVSRDLSTMAAQGGGGRKNDDSNIKPPHAIHDHHNSEMFSYAERHSSDLPSHLVDLYAKTLSSFSKDVAERLCSSELQGRLLSSIASLKQPSLVLELGTFTGYGTLALVDGMLKSVGRNKAIGTRVLRVLTCDIDPKAFAISSDAFAIFNRSLPGDLANKVSIESHKKPATDMIVWAKEKDLKFDLVYIDCDKKNYKSYLSDILGQSGGKGILNNGAVIVVDNTLWKGLVTTFDNDGLFTNKVEVDANDASRSSERYLKIAKHMHEFNCFVKGNSELNQVILPIRDGISLIQYNMSKSSI